MKITKARLKQIIKEELEVTLTNEEATEMFGESVGTQLEEQELNEVDMSQVQIIMDAFAQIGINLSGAAAIGLMGYAMKTAIDLEKGDHSFSKRRRGFAKPEDQQELNEADMSDIQIIISAFAKIGLNLSPAIVMGLIGYAAEQAMGRKKAKPEDEQMMEQQGMTSDVARAGEKIGKVSGIEAALKGINTRQEFETLMMQFIQMVSKEKLKDQDVKIGIRNVAKAVLEDK